MIKRLDNFVRDKTLRLPPNWQRWLDIYIFLNIAVFFIWQSWKVIAEGRLNFIEGVFIVHNIIFCLCFILRRPARAISFSLSHQMVAVGAFYSGLLFVGAEATNVIFLERLAWWLMLAGLVIGLISLLQLGRSFGVLVALREIKTRGLYALVRHPMYLSDILMRLAYFLSHPTALVGVLFLGSSACYVVRAVFEERFIAGEDPAYLEYMKAVRYRFIPGIF